MPSLPRSTHAKLRLAQAATLCAAWLLTAGLAAAAAPAALFSDPARLTPPVVTPPPAASQSRAAAVTNAFVPGAGPVAAGGAAAAPRGAEFSDMSTLDDRHKLSFGDRLSFRIVEDAEDPNETLEPKPVYQPPFQVTDSGDVEIPYIGRYPAASKTCKQLAFEIKAALEKDYYYQATVIIALDQISKTTTGRVYVTGQVRAVGAVEIPADETFTLSKAVLRAGGFTEYADKKRVILTRQSEGGRSTVLSVNLADILERGRTELDPKLEPGDVVFVKTKLVVW